MKRIATFCLLVALIFGCQKLTSPPSSGDDELDFRTDSNSYSLSDEESITVFLKNDTDTQYYIKEPSFNFTLEKYVNGEWKNFGAWYVKVAVVPEPVALEKDRRFPSEIKVGGIREVIDLEEGTYRFEYILYEDESASEDHQKIIHTNSFVLTN